MVYRPLKVKSILSVFKCQLLRLDRGSWGINQSHNYNELCIEKTCIQKQLAKNAIFIFSSCCLKCVLRWVKGAICKSVAKNGYYTQIQNTVASCIHLPLHSKDLKRTRIWLRIKYKISYCPAAAGKRADSGWTSSGQRLDSSTLEPGCPYQDSANAASVSCAANICFYDRC